MKPLAKYGNAICPAFSLTSAIAELVRENNIVAPKE